MAAAYQSGAASSPIDLLNLLVTFLQGQGWTLDSSAVDGSGRRAHLHKGSDYVNFRAAMNEAIWPNLAGSAFYGIGLYMGTGYSGASGWAAQAGGPLKNGGTDTVGAAMRLASGAITAYHFFDDGSDNVVVVIERAGSRFTHLGFGRSLTKSGSWTGGAYFYSALAGKYGGTTTVVGGIDDLHAGAPFAISQPYGTNSITQLGNAAFVRADVDAFTGKWIGFSSTMLTANDGYTGKLGHAGLDYNIASEIVPTDFPGYPRVLFHLVSAFNAQAVLLPIFAFAQRDAGGYSLLGQVPNVFVTSAVEGGYAAGSAYTVNGKNFMLFPRFAVRKFA